jgi:hypothetical protein
MDQTSQAASIEGRAGTSVGCPGGLGLLYTAPIFLEGSIDKVWRELARTMVSSGFCGFAVVRSLVQSDVISRRRAVWLLGWNGSFHLWDLHSQCFGLPHHSWLVPGSAHKMVGEGRVQNPGAKEREPSMVYRLVRCGSRTTLYCEAIPSCADQCPAQASSLCGSAHLCRIRRRAGGSGQRGVSRKAGMALRIFHGDARSCLVYPLAGQTLCRKGLTHLRALQIIYQPLDSFSPGTVGAAIDGAISLDAMSEDAAAAAGTFWSQAVNRTFERVESISLVINSDFEALFVGVSALVATFHSGAAFARTVPRDYSLNAAMAGCAGHRGAACRMLKNSSCTLHFDVYSTMQKNSLCN